MSSDASVVRKSTMLCWDVTCQEECKFRMQVTAVVFRIQIQMLKQIGTSLIEYEPPTPSRRSLSVGSRESRAGGPTRYAPPTRRRTL
jgi:hypothetical protein